MNNDHYVNEDERDSQEQYRLINDDKTAWILTPRGALAASLKVRFGIASSDERITQVWNDIEQWARKYYGYGENIGAIVFDRKGGVFVEIPTIPIVPDDDD